MFTRKDLMSGKIEGKKAQEQCENDLIALRTLQETMQALRNVSPVKNKNPPRKTPYAGRPQLNNQLKQALAKRGTHYQFLPNHLTKSQQNESRYEKGSDRILWTIEWKVPSKNIIHLEHKVKETNSMQMAQDNILSKLDLKSSYSLLYKSPAGEAYYETEMDRSINNTLQKKKVIEFPTFVLATNDDLARYNKKIVSPN